VGTENVKREVKKSRIATRDDSAKDDKYEMTNLVRNAVIIFCLWGRIAYES